MRPQWVTKRIGEIAKTQYGLSEPMNEDCKGFKIFRMGEVQDGRLIDTGRMKYADISPAEFEQYKLRIGDVLFNRTNSFELVGKTGIFMLDGDYCFASYLIRLNLNRNAVLPKFLNYFMNSDRFQGSVKEKASRSINQANINATILSNELIQFPESLSEQQRIVGILDDAFDGIATAKANAEKNVHNARALFDSYLQAIFTQHGAGWVETTIGHHIRFIDYRGKTPKKTESGLRLITAKNVKMGYVQETPMEFVAPESYDGWMTRGIPRLGDVLFTTEAPLANVAQLDTAEKVVFAQRIIVMQPDISKLDSTFLKYLLLSQPVQNRIRMKGTGATVQGIKASLLKTIEISFPSSLSAQKHIVEKLDALRKETQRLESIYRQKLAALDELKKSLLHQAFSGELTGQSRRSAVVIPFPTKIFGVTTTDLHAGILATAFQLHEKNSKQKYFGHVKAEKIAHMVEAHLGIELDRRPVKDAAGPNDFHHLKGVEHRAKMAKFFDFQRVEGAGYQVTKHRQFEELIERTREHLGDRSRDLDSLLELMLPMNTEQAEVFATVYAAWNNLLLDKQPITDEIIVFEARENWHPNKLNIQRGKFFKAIEWMKEHNIIPQGRGKKVNSKVKKKK